jgi:hypothetical protein
MHKDIPTLLQSFHGNKLYLNEFETWLGFVLDVFEKYTCTINANVQIFFLEFFLIIKQLIILRNSILCK